MVKFNQNPCILIKKWNDFNLILILSSNRNPILTSDFESDRFGCSKMDSEIELDIAMWFRSPNHLSLLLVPTRSTDEVINGRSTEKFKKAKNNSSGIDTITTEKLDLDLQRINSFPTL